MKELIDEYNYILNEYLNLSSEDVFKQIDDIQSGNYKPRDLKYFEHSYNWILTDEQELPITTILNSPPCMIGHFRNDYGNLNSFCKTDSRNNDYMFITRNCHGMVDGYLLSKENYRAIQINAILNNDEL